MKLVRILSRLALLSLAAAAFVALTKIYGDSSHPPLPYARFQAAHRHPPSAPNAAKFPEFIRYSLAFAIFAVGGRVAFRLRLNPPSPSEDQPILLGLHPEFPAEP
jgi:hypothetical protein